MARVFSKEVEMAKAKPAVAHKPIWLDLSSSDPAGSRQFYSKVFGWNIEVNPDPQYGGFGVAKNAGQGVAGNGGQKAPGPPTPGRVYIPGAAATATAQKGKG